MTRVVVKEPLDKILAFIKKFIVEQKLSIIEETDSSILGAWAFSELKIFCRWFLKWDKTSKGYIVGLKIDSSALLGVGFPLLSIIIAIFPIFSFFYGMVSIVIYIFLFLFGNAFLRDTENKFIKNIEKELLCSVEKDTDIELLDRRFSWIISVAFTGFLLCLFLKLKIYYIFYYFLIVFLILIIPEIIYAVSRSEFLNWKNNLVFISGYWSLVLSSIILFYIILYYVVWFDKNVLESFSNMISPMRNFVFAGINVIVGTIIFYMICVGIILSKAAWEETIIKENPSIREISCIKSEQIQLFVSKISIIVVFLLASLLNWLAFICIVDTISFLINKEAIIIKGLNGIYAWLIELKGNRIIVPFIIIMCLPFLFSIFLSIARLFQKIFRFSFVKVERLNDELKSKWLELYRALAQISESNKIRAPKLNVVKRNDALCYSEKNILINRARIIISTKALEISEPNELKVIIFHELYHIIKGIGRIELSKSISRLGMFPNYYLSLLFDLNKEEYEADNFAIKELGEEYGGYLTNALFKIDINNKVALKMSKEKKRKPGSTEIIVFAGMRKELRNLGNFLYGQKLLGYSHPSIVQRIEKLKYT